MKKVYSIALQRMLVQEVGDKVLLLPAWPANWVCNFKLHLSKQTILSGKVVDGTLVDWTIFPEDRSGDVVVYNAQQDDANLISDSIHEGGKPIRDKLLKRSDSDNGLLTVGRNQYNLH